MRALGKKGATEWTVAKLMTAILAVLLLALVVYGVSTGGINKLAEKVGGKFNEVMIMFGWTKGDDGVSGDRTTIDVKVPVGNGVIWDASLTFGKDVCKLNFESGGPKDTGLNFKNGNSLERYETVYYIKTLGPIGLSGITIVNDAYFRFNGFSSAWEWSTDKVDWLPVPGISFKSRSGNLVRAGSTMKVIISKLKDKDLKEGLDILKKDSSKFEEKIGWVDIDQEVLDKESFKMIGLYELMLENSKHWTFESRWPDSGGLKHFGTRDVWVGYRGLRTTYEDGYSFTVGYDWNEKFSSTYLWELPPAPNDNEWKRWSYDELKNGNKVNRLNLYFDLQDRITRFGVDYGGVYYRFSLRQGPPEALNLFAVQVYDENGKSDFYGLDWANNFWKQDFQEGGDWEKKGNSESLKSAAVNKYIKEFLIVKCR